MENIKLQNFRCFENLDWSFTPGINLIVGDNASGKTSLLRACRLVAGSFFAGYSDENTVWPGPETIDFRQIIDNGVVEPFKPVEIEFSLCRDVFPTIHMDMAKYGWQSMFNPAEGNPYLLKKTSPKNSKQQTSGIKAYKIYASELQKIGGKDTALPLFSYFSTEDIHATRSIPVDKFREEFHKASFGYYMCLDSNGLLPYWERRMLTLKEADPDSEELKLVVSAMADALGPSGCGILRNVHIRPMRGKVLYELSDSRMADSSTLSDGYKRLVNIVVSVAIRACLLNRRLLGDDVMSETKGVVMIDEIDQHLHPSLQVRALPALAAVFPGIQFITTTHSPLVMSSVGNTARDCVQKIWHVAEGEYRYEKVDTLGNDASSIITDVLEMSNRDISAQKELDHLFELIDAEQLDEANELLERLKIRYRDLPELARAAAAIEFLSC